MADEYSKRVLLQMKEKAKWYNILNSVFLFIIPRAAKRNVTIRINDVRLEAPAEEDAIRNDDVPLEAPGDEVIERNDDVRLHALDEELTMKNDGDETMTNEDVPLEATTENVVVGHVTTRNDNDERLDALAGDEPTMHEEIEPTTMINDEQNCKWDSSFDSSSSDNSASDIISCKSTSSDASKESWESTTLRQKFENHRINDAFRGSPQ